MNALSPLLSVIKSFSGMHKTEEIPEKSRFERQTQKILQSRIMIAFMTRFPLKQNTITIYEKSIERIDPTVFEKGEMESYVKGTYRKDKHIAICRFAPA